MNSTHIDCCNFNKRGKSVLGFHVRRGNCEMIKRRIAKGANPNSTYYIDDSRPLLEIAFHTLQNGSFKLLLDQGADPNTQFSCGFYALNKAAYYGYAEYVEALLDRGADPTLRSDYTFPNEWTGCGLSALHFAADEDANLKCVELLLQHLDPDITDFHGRTPLHYAVDRRAYKSARALIFAGADWRKVCMPGWSLGNQHAEDVMTQIVSEYERQRIAQAIIDRGGSGNRTRMI